MSIMEGLLTALFIVAIVFMVLVMLWLIVRVLGSLIQVYERMQAQLKASDTQSGQQG